MEVHFSLLCHEYIVYFRVPSPPCFYKKATNVNFDGEIYSLTFCLFDMQNITFFLFALDVQAGSTTDNELRFLCDLLLILMIAIVNQSYRMAGKPHLFSKKNLMQFPQRRNWKCMKTTCIARESFSKKRPTGICQFKLKEANWYDSSVASHSTCCYHSTVKAASM